MINSFEKSARFRGLDLTPAITEIIEEVLSQAAKDGLLEPYHD